MLKYKSIGMASVVQTHRTDGKPNVFDLVTPVFDSLPSVDPSDIGIFSLASPYYCSLVRYEQSGDVLTCSFVNGADPEWVTHERKDGKDHFHLKMNAILPLIGYEPGGRGFESCRARQTFKGPFWTHR